MGCSKGIVGMCETSYGMLRGRIKSKERDGSRCTREEKAWGKREQGAGRLDVNRLVSMHV